MARVDVSVPCYQYGRYLRTCVGSVLSQGVQDLRVLIIDNASTDNSLEVARALAAADPRVQVVAHAANLGHHSSFNEGIDWASGDYFMTLCADDLLAPGCLSRAVSFMEEHPDVHLTYGETLLIHNDDPIPPIEPCAREAKWHVFSGRQLLEMVCRAGGRHGIGGPTVVVRTSVQKRAGYYRPELPHTDDFEMWMRFARFGSVARTDAVQGIARVHSMTRTTALSNALMWDLHREAAFESFFANDGASAPGAKDLRRLARRHLAERAYWGAVATFVRGDGRLGLNLLKFAFTRDPLTMVVPPMGYLFRRGNALRHIAEVLSEAARSLGIPTGEANRSR